MENEDEISSGHNHSKFRKLDTRIGRFLSVDPAASMYYSWSPYGLSLDNPIANSDPSGATVTPAFERGSKHHMNYLRHTVDLLFSSPMYNEIHYSIHFSNKKCVLRMATKNEVKKLYFEGKDYYAWYDESTNEIVFNPYIFIGGDFKELDGHREISKGSLFEEMFHRRQSLFESSPVSLASEVDAKTAKLYAAYHTLSDEDKTKSGKVLERFNEWEIPEGEMGLLLDKEGNIKNNVAGYFDKKNNGQKIDQSSENSFRSSVKEFGEMIGTKYGGDYKNQTGSYKGETKLFDELTK